MVGKLERRESYQRGCGRVEEREIGQYKLCKEKKNVFSKRC